MDSVVQWFKDSWEGIKDFFEAFMNTLLDMLKDLAYWMIDMLMDFGIVILDTFTTALTIMDPVSYISAIPPDVANILGLIGLGEAVGIIMAAISVRLLLQLIPFVRLGS